MHKVASAGAERRYIHMDVQVHMYVVTPDILARFSRVEKVRYRIYIGNIYNFNRLFVNPELVTP